jgi:hypothetical protein
MMTHTAAAPEVAPKPAKASPGRVPTIELARGADENGLAVMLSDLVRQNLEAKPHKQKDFFALRGSVTLVADDAEVALTLRFKDGVLTVFDGIVGIPDVTVRGSSDTILALSNVPLSTPFALPLPDPRDQEEVATVRALFDAMRSGRFHVYGLFFHLPLLMRLTRVMSVNG